MKKIYIYMVFVAAAVAILAVSCVRELDIQRPVTGNQAVISLTPFCVDPVTKADPEPTEPGDNTYNENTISGYYWFISGTADGNILLGGYTPGDGETSIPINSAFPIQNGNNGFVYVIANLPQKPESPAKGDEWFEYDVTSKGIKHFVQGASTAASTTYSGTIANLQTIDFGKSMPTSYPKSSEFYEYTSATTGVPKPERFVMRTENPVPFRIVNNASDPIPVKAELKRVAVKIILDLYVAKTVVQYKTNADGTQSYEKTWDSDMSHIQIYMLWGSTRGNLAGTPIRYGEDGVEAEWFYSASPRYAMYKNPDGGQYNNSTNSISGSVPSSLYPTTDYLVKSTVWDYVYQVNASQGDNGWIWKNDVASEDMTEENRGDYYYGDWAYVSEDKPTVIDEETGNAQRRSTTQTEKKTYYKISSLPLYTMPIKWNVNDAHAPFIKVILPWMGYDTTKGETPSLNNSKEFYYKILIPELTELDANGCYHVKLDLSVLGSTADEVPVEISGEYHVVDWNSPVEAMGGDQTAGRYLDCGTYFEFYSQNEMEIPVRSSHNLSVVLTGTYAPKSNYNNYSGNTVTTGSLTRHTSSSTGDYYMISASGNNKVTVTHTMETSLNSMASRDVSPITYTFRIQHADDAKYYKDITVVQYPSLYITREASNGYLFVNGYGRPTTGNSHATSWDNRGERTLGSSGYLNYFLGGVMHMDGVPSNTNNYDIHTSALSSSSEYILMDPREDTMTDGSMLYLTGLTNYRKTRSDVTKGIAPIYKVASFYGACVPVGYNGNYGVLSHDGAVKRCASYQENGYPAGRWRLPTEAEIEYAISLSLQGLIPVLFNSTYWASSGRAYSYSAKEFQNATQAVVRCVYDSWYWGDEKLSNPTVWGGFQTDYMNN
jgi:hypothetical protein